MSPAPPPPADGRSRCGWATGEWLTPYHDTEWGVVVHDDRTHFEFLVLEGAQAGLSWLTVLKRRDHYRRLFAHFDAATVAGFGDREVAAMLQDPGVIRNRMKLESAVSNARALLQVAAEYGSFDAYLWSFVDGSVVTNHWMAMTDIPATSPVSDRLSRDLRRRGFRFVGATVCYSHLQAAGLVNDHLVGCFRHDEV